MSAEQVMEIMKEAMLVAFEIAGPLLIISIQEMMAHAALLVGYDRIEIDILHAFKDIALHKWILRF